jgi:hypothetical protein
MGIKNSCFLSFTIIINITGPLSIPSTYVAADIVPWRQWHHWNYIDNLAKIDLKRGEQTMTIHTIETGEMNYDYIDFKLIK